MARYAENTTVGVDRTKTEIERTLTRYGATRFYYSWEMDMASIGFEIACRSVKILLPLPNREDFRLTPTRKVRTPASQQEAWEQACRQRWRALALVIKAKLEAVECGISTIEREFLADVLLPNGQTFGEWVAPQMTAIARGSMPRALPAGGVE